MRLVSTSACSSGVKLAKPVYNENGSILLNSGFELSDSTLKRLRGLGVSFVYVFDRATADIEGDDEIPLEVREEAIAKIKSLFVEVGNKDLKLKSRISVSHMVSAFSNVSKMLLEEVKKSKCITNLLTNIYTYDNYVYTHSLNVTFYTLSLGLAKGYNDKQLHDLGLGGLFHDIGKMLVSPDVLNKPGKLTDMEFEEIKRHSEHGFNILRHEFEIPTPSAHCAFQHHEKWNGTGYPRRLRGDEIHHFSRLMAVCDVFDAVSCNRVYRKAMLPHTALEIILSGNATHFDPEAVDLFYRTIAIYPVGLTVRLSTGETAVVIRNHKNIPSRPVIRVIRDSQGIELSTYHEIDLATSLSIMIDDCESFE